MNPWLYRFRSWRLRRKLVAGAVPEAVRFHLDVPSTQKFFQPADKSRFVVFDVEMTGLGPGDRLLSVGAVRIDASRLILGDNFHEIVDPGRDIPPETVLVHNIVPGMASGRPSAATIMPEFLKFIGSDVLVAHNARFDLEFINREMTAHFGLPLLNPVIDLLLLSRTNSYLREKYVLTDATTDHSLDGLAAAFGLTIEDRHSAFGDSLAAGLIFLRLMKSLQRFGIYKVKHLYKAGGL
ncbi:MAG: 3'-5' exonuclease [Pseudomonadota bacterium]